MNKRRVVVTGIGAVTPNGNNVDEFWHALINGQSGIGEITQFDSSEHTVKIAGEVSDFNPESFLEPREIRKLDRFAQFALMATNEAVINAQIDWETFDRDRVGVIYGTGVGGIKTLEEQQNVLLARSPRRVSPQFVPKMIANIAASQIAIRWGLMGPNQTIVSACASGTDAVGIAFRLIQYGDVDVVVSGGAETSITPLTIAGFANMKALSSRNENPQEASRPFDLDRDGFVLGEGAGTLILEALDHALDRNATILAEVAGYGATDDAFHITQPHKAGAVKAMSKALRNAQKRPEDVQYINAHGTSTLFNDKNESEAIKEVFGNSAQKVKISSTKSMIGHLLGASGAVEAIASIKTIISNTIHPTINYTTPDPECDLNYVPNKAIEHQVDTAISNSFGFGGHNAVLVLTRWNPED
jgi:3-oxoacyl-[acyl-carrier-protein] synthase II